MHLITEGQATGFDEDNIVNGVIRAMVSILTLKNVLQTTSNLTLGRLLVFWSSLWWEEKPLERGLGSTYVVQEIRHLLRTGV